MCNVYAAVNSWHTVEMVVAEKRVKTPFETIFQIVRSGDGNLLSACWLDMFIWFRSLFYSFFGFSVCTKIIVYS